MSYYDDLETTASASAEEIKARWRRMSSEYHPDKKGGSVEAMQKINKAYEVLGDPERRAHYDATGEAAEQPPVEEEALRMLMGALAQGIEADPLNPLRWVQQVLDGVQAQLLQAQNLQQDTKRKLARLTGRFKVKQGENMAQGLIDAKMRDARAALAQIERGLAANASARTMLTNYSFEEPAAEPAQASLPRYFSTSTAWRA